MFLFKGILCKDFSKKHYMNSFKNSHHLQPDRSVWFHLHLQLGTLYQTKTLLFDDLGMRAGNQLLGWCFYEQQLINPTYSAFKLPLHSKLCFFSCVFNWMFELHCTEWCMCKVWHWTDVLTSIFWKMFLSAHSKSHFYGQAYKHDLWHQK